MAYPTEKQQKVFWDDWVSRSIAWKGDNDNQRRGYYILREVKNNFRPNLKIIDIGCGNGWLSLELKRFGEVTGIDFSRKAIDVLKAAHKGIKWIDGDLCSLDLPYDFFDIITCVETIAHIPDQAAFARKISMIARKKRAILLLTTQNEYIWSRTSWLQPPANGQIRNWPSRSRLVNLFSPYFSISGIRTCAPGGDKGIPRLFNNRISRSIGSWIFGRNNWIKLLESFGLGRSLFMVARR